MNKKIIIAILFAFGFQLAFSQEKLLPGYIIQLNGDTTKGYIDYRNWEKNPSNVIFQEGQNNVKNSYSPTEIAGFGLQNEVYKSAIVQIEASIENKSLTTQHSTELTFKTDTAFIQTIFAGEKSLFLYKTSFGTENFYIKQGSEYELLVYKKYVQLVDGTNKIMENKKFLGQLALYLQDCSSINKQLSKTKYSIKSLEKLFTYYYQNTTTEIQFHKKADPIKTEFGLLAGVSLTNLKFGSSNSYFDYMTTTDWPLSTRFSGGIFLDIILPKNHGKWSINNELVYTSYEVTGHYEDYSDVDRYTYMDMKFGMSYVKLNNMVRYKFLIKNTFLYFNGGLSNGYAVQVTNYKMTEIKFFTSDTFIEGKALEDVKKYDLGYLLGVGVKFKKFSLEARREANINGITTAVALATNVTRYYFFLGYRF